MSDEKFQISVTVNGVRQSHEVEGRYLLADLLRRKLGLTGTHVGCGHGACGACTVIVDGRTVRSCLTFAVQADGAEIETVESLAQEDGTLNTLQEEFRKSHALQCGFCTPGMLMSATALLRDTPSPTEEQIREGMAGNLCRCTGYDAIVKAIAATGQREV